MVRLRRLQGSYCIDRWESSLVRVGADGKTRFWPSNRPVDGVEREVMAASVSGRKPQGYISGQQAALACGRAGKRLCEIDEWVRACRGSRFLRYPYGNQRSPNLCNDRFKKLDHHPVVTLFRREAAAEGDPKLLWHPSRMNDPRLFELAHTVSPTGAFERCTNDFQVYDMVGNLHEWVADPDGTFMGGFFMDTFQNGEGCEYRTIAHPFDYHDYSTGFRCCADPRARS
jgi:formylglycine-generating enzyme required for sulfatase activity